MQMGKIVMESIIKTQDVTYSYVDADTGMPQKVLNGVSLEIEKGSFVAILGHNGSGKSTFAKLLNGIFLPETGAVYIDGMNTADESLLIEIRRRVGMVFQNPDNQIVSNVVEEDVAFAPENLGYPSEEIRRRVDEALKVVGMQEYRLHAPHLLSGGQKQRIAIAGVLAMSPECIVFDEPTAMLDPRGRRDVIEIIRKLREMGKTVVLITHHMDETIDADRLIVMSDGHVIMDGTPKEVFKNVEAVRLTGLDVPETVDLMYELNKGGFDLDLTALSVDECAREIYRAVK
jgi:energy-coupling factor transport system ATP-binding protein